MLRKTETAPLVCWDVETVGLHPENHKDFDACLYTIGFGFPDSVAYVIPLEAKAWPENFRRAIYEALTKWITETNPEQIRVAHNLAFDLKWVLRKVCSEVLKVASYEVPLVGKYHDTALLSWLLDERSGASGLKVSGFRNLGTGVWDNNVDVTNIRKYPLADVYRYNGLDAYFTVKLFEKLFPRVEKNPDFQTLYYELLLPAVFQCMQMELRGTDVDEKYLENLYTTYQKRVKTLEKELVELTGNEAFNPNSTKQLREYFVDKMKYEIPKKTASGAPSTDKESLELLAATYGDPLAERLLEHRRTTKLFNTYIAGMPKHLFKTGKFHGGYNLTGTVTGRTSSSNPNMQNFPKREDQEVRYMVVPPPGHLIVSFDYGQIEARVFGMATGDPDFVEALKNDYDVHLENSKILFGEEQAKKMRSPVKNATFAMLYGSGIATAAKQAGVDHGTMSRLRNLFFSRFKKFLPWQNELIAEEKTSGHLKSLFGRRRRAPMTRNELFNYVAQSSASDIAVYAMIHLGRRFPPALFLHDDITFFLPDDENLPESLEYIADGMLTLPWIPLSKSKKLKSWVPLSVECSVGEKWGDQEDLFQLNATQRGYDSLEACLEKARNMKEELAKYRTDVLPY